MIHDQTASTLSLARNVRSGIDVSKPETTVPTATLMLLLNTLIDIGSGGRQERVAESAARTVAQTIAQMTAGDGFGS